MEQLGGGRQRRALCERRAQLLVKERHRLALTDEPEAVRLGVDLGGREAEAGGQHEQPEGQPRGGQPHEPLARPARQPAAGRDLGGDVGAQPLGDREQRGLVAEPRGGSRESQRRGGVGQREGCACRS